MPESNPGFVSSIQSYDPLLDVRWGNHIKRWVVERKSFITETELWFLTRRAARFKKWSSDPYRTDEERAKFREEFNEISEELDSAKSGRRIVLMPAALNMLAFNTLAQMDIHRWGGFSRMADELERAESRREADLDRQMANEREVLNKHTYDILNWVWKHRDTQLTQENLKHKSLKEIIGTSEL